ncbi:uncharacterized protein LOC126266445 isoform X2 [Aethina tumida]|uniref:uncharacterized protein LOC126266445 isoform X2 n=1 Tax=Aethina tumida TaxID=116153 RepID=UPI0021481D93|nr:uncharacterized protein LOC126266445 isoform X2 [Aethina tumida]
MNKPYSLSGWFNYASFFGVIPHYNSDKSIVINSFKRKLFVSALCILILCGYCYSQVRKIQAGHTVNFVFLTEFSCDLIMTMLCLQNSLKNTFMFEAEWSRLYNYQEVTKTILIPAGLMEIRRARTTFGKLNTVMGDINAIFGWDMFFLFLFSGLQILTCFCYSAEYFLDGKYTKIILAGILMTVLICLISLALVSLSCHKVVTNVNEISSACYKMLEENHLETDLQNELLLLANYVKNELPEFTAAGFFTINRSTLCSMFSITITYFIVALQVNNYIK